MTTMPQIRSAPPRQKPTWPGLAAVLVAAAGVGLAILHHENGQPQLASWFSSIAFGAPVAVGGGLAFAAIRRGNGPVAVAAVLGLIPVAYISFVLLPLLVPIVAVAVYSARRMERATLLGWVLAAGITAGLPAAFFALLVHDDPASWTSEDGRSGGSSSDVITTTEAAVSLAMTGAVLVVGVAALRQADRSSAARR